jgi:hypothetical protein
MTRCVVALFATFAFALSMSPGRAQEFQRGDANLDARVNIADAVTILGVLFLGDEDPGCADARDTDDDGALVISDGIFVLNYLFLGGPPPSAPFEACGVDPTDDDLDCEVSPPTCAEDDGCFGDDDLNRTTAENIEATQCVEADSAFFQLGDVTITICPFESADLCDGQGTIGCAVILDEIVAEIHPGDEEATATISGFVREMPVTLSDGVNELACQISIDFTLFITVPFQAFPNEDGALVVEFVKPGRIDDYEAELSVTGGVECEIIDGAQELFIEDIIVALEAASGEVLGDINEFLVGQILCEEE